MGEPREPDTPPDGTRPTDPWTREADEVDLTRVAEEWKQQTREANEQWSREVKARQEARDKTQEEKERSPSGILLDGVNCCAWWSLTMLMCAVLPAVAIAACARRAKG